METYTLKSSTKHLIYELDNLKYEIYMRSNDDIKWKITELVNLASNKLVESETKTFILVEKLINAYLTKQVLLLKLS